MAMELTEFEKEVIRDWRILKSQESLILTKSAERSGVEGIIEKHTRKIISKNNERN